MYSSYCTHEWLPLDLDVMRPSSSYYSVEVQSGSEKHLGRVVTPYQVAIAMLPDPPYKNEIIKN